jgi:hypothetical protein
VDRQIRFIENEINALSNSLQAARSLLGQWKQNELNGASVAVPAPSVGTMKEYITGMRCNLETMDDILAATDD